jgi:hypothetical protein
MLPVYEPQPAAAQGQQHDTSRQEGTASVSSEENCHGHPPFKFGNRVLTEVRRFRRWRVLLKSPGWSRSRRPQKRRS